MGCADLVGGEPLRQVVKFSVADLAQRVRAGVHLACEQNVPSGDVDNDRGDDDGAGVTFS